MDKPDNERRCPLCGEPVTMTDTEYDYEYCFPCQWRGSTKPPVKLSARREGLVPMSGR